MDRNEPAAFTLPPAVGRWVARLPQWPPSAALAASLTYALGRTIQGGRLQPLRGKTLALHVTDAGLRLRVVFTGTVFAPAFGSPAEDVSIRASAWDFLQLARRAVDPDSLFFNRRLTMEGDTELGLLVKNTLDAIDLAGLVPQFLRTR